MMFLCLMLLLSVAASAGDEAEGIWIPTRMVGIDYPVLAQQSRTHGVVKVACTIASDGTVSSAKITSGSLLLGASILERISQWKFDSLRQAPPSLPVPPRGMPRTPLKVAAPCVTHSKTPFSV
jgi:TonB family protein